MRILLTNDDGLSARGIAVLERIARTLSDDVWVVAPKTDQSGMSHALTLAHPLRVSQIDDRHFSVAGTPTDCVITALRSILPAKPDLILSGINHGHNIGDDVPYSGTIACAMEGCMNGILSIALSQSYHWDRFETLSFDVAEHFAPKIIRQIMTADLPPHVFASVNFPKCTVSNVKGVRITTQDRGNHSLDIETRIDTRSHSYQWIKFSDAQTSPTLNGDVRALLEDHISITPLTVNLTSHSAIDALSQVFYE
jgi:5'-nucleotidase